MAVDDPGVVDILSIDASGRVVITIADHLDWTDSVSHQKVLQEKINRYLAFVESGEMLDSYPPSEGKQVLVRVVTKHQPDEDGLCFLGRAKAALSEAGFQFEWTQFSPARED